MEMQNGKIIWLLIWLAVWGIADIRRREIHAGGIWLVGAVGVLWQLITGQLFTWDIGGGILIGAFFWVLSGLSEGRMGKGDALAILCMGLYVGWRISLAFLMLAFLLSAGAASYLLLVRKKSGQYAMPFLPFLAVAAGIGSFWMITQG